MNRAIKYRLYPTDEQCIMFAKTFGCCRKVYNLMLSDKIDYYRKNKKMLHNTPAQYKADYPFLKEVDSLALANVQLNLQSAYAAFFRDRRIGFPKFKSAKHSRKSYTTNNQNGTVSVGDNFIRLPKVGMVKAVIHRIPEEGWKLKSATISMDSDGKYYASVLFEYEDCEAQVSVSSSAAIGLDYKSDGLYMDSNGYSPAGHKYYRNSQKKLAAAQRKLRKKTVGSSNYKKQQLKIAHIHSRIANQRKDFLHKESAKIANSYDIVCVESLDMKAMSNKGFGNGKATLDNGYGMFLNMLEYKLKAQGKMLVKVDRWFPSSQICSACGRRKMMPLSERTYRCCCGYIIDRDINAAVNIKNEGLRMLEAA